MAERESRAVRITTAISTWLTRVIVAFTGYALPALLSAVLLGSVVFYLSGKDRVRLFGSNNLSFAHQLSAVYPVAGALGLLLLLFVSVLVVRRLRKRPVRAAALFSRIGDFLLPLGAAPFLAALTQQEIEKKTPFLTLFYAVLAGAFVGVGCYRIARPASELEPVAEGRTEKLRNLGARAFALLTPIALLSMAGAYAYHFSKLALTNHRALVTRVIDLGIYDNIFYQSAHGNFLGCTFIKAEYHGSAHFDPMLVLLSPLYLLYPRAEFILVLQSVWVASAAIPVFLIGQHFLKSRFQALCIAAIYLVHPAIHGSNLYEFHSLTMAPMPILWTLYCLVANKRRAYWFALVCALLVREDVPLMLFMVGATTMLVSRAQRNLGFATTVVCVIYFVIVKLVFMTSSSIVMTGAESYSFAYYYQELIQGGKGIGSLALSLLTNPAFVVAQVTEEAKIQFLATVFLPLGLLPFLAKGRRLYLLYGLLLTLLASRTAVFSTHFQYTSTLIPFAFALLPEAAALISRGDIARVKGLAPEALQRALVVGSLVIALGVSYKFGGIVENKSFRGGFYPVARQLNAQQEKLYAWVDQTATSIPKDKSVGVTNKLGPHVSNRRKVYFYGARGTDYVFVDENELKKDRRDSHKKAIAEGRLVEISRHGSYALFEAQAGKKPAEDQNGDISDMVGDDRE